MDDQFLQRLRRDPPAGFVARLKWQLDRPVAPSPARARLLLVCAIFGTAFALVSPPARRIFGELFYADSGAPQNGPGAKDPAGRRPTASTGTSADPVAARGAPRSADPANLRHSPGLQSPPPADAGDPQTIRPEALPIATASSGSGSVIVPNLMAQTSHGAEAAVATRQGLFKVLSFAFAPLGSMLEGSPVNTQLVSTDAHRLNALSAMIPELFRDDTSASDVKTRALETIWQQPADFASKAEALSLAADELGAAVATHDQAAVLEAIRRVGKSCTGCHDLYRKN